jgi:hypothetical protein
MKRPRPVLAVLLASFALALALGALACPEARANAISDATGEAFDRADCHEGADASSGDGSQLVAQSTLSPLYGLSDELRYFTRFESGQNYDEGLSSGDGYHAMGYYQFDNRYGLGEFLDGCYQYNPSTYSMFAQFEGVDLESATLHDASGLTDLGSRLDAAWHAAYAASPSEFSALQDAYAYDTYYTAARSGFSSVVGGSLDDRGDYVRGLCWGLCNLYGQTGWKRFLSLGSISSAMDDQTLAYALCQAVIDYYSTGGGSSSVWRSGYVSRYQQERSLCLSYGYADADGYAASSAGGVLAAGTYEIEASSNTAQVLDVVGGSNASGANVQLYASNGTGAQAWVVTVASGGYCTIANRGSGKVLDVAGGIARWGTNVQQWDQNGSRAQLWVARTNGDGSVTFHSALGQGLVLDLSGASTANGTNVQVWSENDSPAQRFACADELTRRAAGNKGGAVLGSGCYTVSTGLSSSKVLDVSGAGLLDMANVQVYSRNDTVAQTWYVSVDAKGFVTLTDVGSGKVLDVAGGSPLSGTNAWQYAGNGSAAQRWAVERNADGTLTLWSALGNGQVLDVAGGSSADGANVWTYASNGSAAQRWAFSPHDVLSGGTYEFAPSAARASRLDVAGGSGTDGANVQIWSRNGTAAQRWSVSSAGSGAYSIRNVGSGKCLDVAGASSQAGTNVWQFAPNGSRAQVWQLVMGTDGLRVQSALGTTLDVSGGASEDGTNVQAWTANGTEAQVWCPVAA